MLPLLRPAHRHQPEAPYRELALLLAEGAPATPDAARTLLESSYGLTHEPTVDKILPGMIATAEALAGRPHDTSQLDPVVARQLQHSLALDGRPLTKRADVPWCIDNGRPTQPPAAGRRHPARQS